MPYMTLHRESFNIEDMLDWRVSAASLRQECEERAWKWYDGPEYDGMEARFQIDGGHVIVRLIAPIAG